MTRKLEIKLTALSGAVSEAAVWVNDCLVFDGAPGGADAANVWQGKIQTAATQITIEAGGIGASRYGVRLVVDGQVVTDIDRQLQGGIDVYLKSV